MEQYGVRFSAGDGGLKRVQKKFPTPRSCYQNKHWEPFSLL